TLDLLFGINRARPPKPTRLWSPCGPPTREAKRETNGQNNSGFEAGNEPPRDSRRPIARVLRHPTTDRGALVRGPVPGQRSQAQAQGGGLSATHARDRSGARPLR